MSDGIVIRDGDIANLTEAVQAQGQAISRLGELVLGLSKELARQRDHISNLKGAKP